ncbi:MOSC domain-containing protein [Streptomyces sp. NPDC055078]
MSQARLTEIARYPVKGFPGHTLPDVTLVPGRGLPMDRVCGVLNGTVEAGEDGGWLDSVAFLRLLRNAELARYDVTVVGEPAGGGDGVLRITAPDGRSAEIVTGADGRPRPAGPARADAELGDWFPAGPRGAVRLRGPGTPLWDWPDAAVSLINLDSLDDLAAVSGRPVDRRRFRANLYVSGLGAWQEFGLLGHRVRLGDAELEIVQTTERCRATTVEPGTGRRNLPVPVLLASRYGHLCCGVYARVVRGGTVAPGDALTDLGPLVDPATLPAIDPGWPRPAELAARTAESPTVSSLTFRDPAGARCRPGQHLRVHLTDGAGPPMWRCYTVTGSSPTGMRISVKRVDDGRVSPLLHTLPTGSRVLVSGPYGDELTAPDSARPLLLACAGIGVTPVLPVLRHLVEENPKRAVTVLNVVRTTAETPLWEEVTGLLVKLPNSSHRLYVSAPDPGAPLPDGALRGRPSPAEVAALAEPAASTEVYLCGPRGFVQGVREALVAAGVPDDAISDELFFTPGEIPLEELPPPLPGPFTVDFSVAGIRAVWSAADGTLLDLAESAGLDLPSACRSGGCGSCRQRVTGEVHHLITPAVPVAPGQALLCCAVPKGDVTVRA